MLKGKVAMDIRLPRSRERSDFIEEEAAIFFGTGEEYLDLISSATACL